MKGWSFRDLERELRSNLIYRRFTHYDAEATPDFTSFSRCSPCWVRPSARESMSAWCKWRARVVSLRDGS
jgi:hypothetical protein